MTNIKKYEIRYLSTCGTYEKTTYTVVNDNMDPLVDYIEWKKNNGVKLIRCIELKGNSYEY